jgi:DNA invertase Pin-like site-specific DNA recombinase
MISRRGVFSVLAGALASRAPEKLRYWIVDHELGRADGTNCEPKMLGPGFGSAPRPPASRRCRAFAERNGWTVIANFVKSDAAVSGAATRDRKALDSLIHAAKTTPRPFDRILVDDTSRLSRNTSDFLHLVEVLQFHGVALTAVSQGIDTDHKATRPMLAFQGMMDEQYLVGLAEKVHRGQEGRVLKGLHPGGRCYGYRNVPIEDPTRAGKYGRLAVSGLEIDEDQAAVVRRIFQMYADGGSLAGIAKFLNEEGTPPPQARRDGGAWSTTEAGRCGNSSWIAG